MATQVVFGNALDLSKGVGGLPIFVNEGAVSETITSTASNQQTTITAPALGHNPVALISTDTAVYVAIGANPNALSGTTRRYLYPAGAVFAIGCAAGDKVAVVNA